MQREINMTIQELIEVAKQKDADFNRKITHRLEKRQKSPDFDWLIDNLVAILGADYVEAAAKAQIEKEAKLHAAVDSVLEEDNE